MDRLLITASIGHGWMVLGGALFFLLDEFYWVLETGAFVILLHMLFILIAGVLYYLSYLTIPLSIIALVCRRRALGHFPAKERLRFGPTGAALLIALQVLCALVGWLMWNSLINMMF